MTAISTRAVAPRAVPDLRLDLLADWLPGGENRALLTHLKGDDKAAIGADEQRRNLAASSLWFIGSEMADLAHQAAPSIPTNCTLSPEMVPDRTGLMVFERPFIPADVIGERQRRVAGYLWNLGIPGDPSVLALWPYVWHPPQRWDQRLPTFTHTTHWVTGEPLGIDASVHMRLLFSIFALAASPGICEQGSINDRHAAKRTARVGVDRALSETRIIKLRRLGAEAIGEGVGRSHRHRWIVSGHWRSQPYGPRNSLRKPVWIAPHIKGPDGAPMLTGDKVKALVR